MRSLRLALMRWSRHSAAVLYVLSVAVAEDIETKKACDDPRLLRDQSRGSRNLRMSPP